MWKETVQQPPPKKETAVINEPSLDYEFFDRVCIRDFAPYLRNHYLHNIQVAQCLMITPLDSSILFYKITCFSPLECEHYFINHREQICQGQILLQKFVL